MMRLAAAVLAAAVIIAADVGASDGPAPADPRAQLVDTSRLQRPITGNQRFVTILCKFADIASEPQPLSYFTGMYSSASPGLDHYWREQSYNTIDLTGSTAAGWFALPHALSYYTSRAGGVLGDDCIAAADPSVDFRDFIGVNMVFNGNFGTSFGGSWCFTADGMSSCWRATLLSSSAWAHLSIVEHEMGHSFQLPHSSGPYAQTYDSAWDVMSKTLCTQSDATYGCLGQHTIGFHKFMAGWLTPRTIAPQAPVTTMNLERLALPQTAEPQLVMIPIGSSGGSYSAEARMRAGHDSRLPADGVVLHRIDTRQVPWARVVDPDNNNDPSDAGAVWTPGETFTDPSNGITVSVLAATASGYQISVTNSSPVATSNSPICFGEALQLSVTEVAGGSYSWQGPNGFTASVRTPSIDSPATEASGIYKATVQTPSGSSAPMEAAVTVYTAATVSPAAFTFTAAGGGDYVVVNAGSTCAWTAVSNSAFITITTPANQTGYATVSFSVEPNPQTVSRSGTLTVAGKTVAITQMGAFGTPPGFSAAALNASDVHLTWSAVSDVAHYEIHGGTSLGSIAYVAAAGANATALTLYGLSSGVTHLFRIRAISTSGAASAFSPVEATTTVVFTDDPVVPVSMRIAAAHVTELRAAVNAFRAAAGLGAFPFTDATPAGVQIKTIHIQQLRDALAAARTALGLPAVTYTDPALTPRASMVKAIHINELRNAVK